MRYNRQTFLDRALHEVDLASQRTGRKLKAFVENRGAAVPQLFIFDEFIAPGPVLMFLVSDDGFIPFRSFGQMLPMDLQRPFGLRKLYPFISSLPRQPDDEFIPIEFSDVIQSLRYFWCKRQRL